MRYISMRSLCIFAQLSRSSSGPRPPPEEHVYMEIHGCVLQQQCMCGVESGSGLASTAFENLRFRTTRIAFSG